MTIQTNGRTDLDSLLTLCDSIVAGKPKTPEAMNELLGLQLTLRPELSTPVARVYTVDTPGMPLATVASVVMSLLPKNDVRLLFALTDNTMITSQQVAKRIGQEPRIETANPANRSEQIMYYVFTKEQTTIKFGFDLMKNKQLVRLVVDYKR